MSENGDGPGSNMWDFLQTFVTHPTTVKLFLIFLVAVVVLILLALGVLDGNAMVGWFKEVWHTIRGVA